MEKYFFFFCFYQEHAQVINNVLRLIIWNCIAGILAKSTHLIRDLFSMDSDLSQFNSGAQDIITLSVLFIWKRKILIRIFFYTKTKNNF
ncbi:hypothetical protein PV328_009085 [Microctonus aethiopoides]|uniref:Uncharacterized protein n=1 Tax=Microctonus aethiopoides TaxID=144406 RepID=A0AA39KRX3_9HYME|nr:hypothetical protein PV328_009085 [Microctonus aethiopoides]